MNLDDIQKKGQEDLKKLLYEKLFKLEKDLINAIDSSVKFKLEGEIKGIKKKLLELGEMQFRTSEIPSSILNNIPYRSCKHFTGRVKELCELKAQLQSKKQVLISPAISVTGCGGVGKTELAVEYCYRYAEDYQAICWVDASETAFKENYTNLASLLLPDLKDTKQKMEIVRNALKTKFPSILLILDNVENSDLVEDWIPNSEHCQVIITSRKRDILGVEELNLNTLPKEDACDLLCSRRKEDLDPTSEDAKELAERLACLPLALDIAAHYLGRRRDISLEKYQQKLEEYGLLNSIQYNPEKYKNFTDHQDRAVYATIMESWYYLGSSNTELSPPQELLQYISWCHPEKIPLDWIRNSINWDEDKFYNVVATLFEYNLLLGWNHQLASTHILINEVIRTELFNNEPQAAIIQVNSLLENIKIHFDSEEGNNPEDYNSWEHQSRYAQQALTLLTKREKYADNKLLIAWLSLQVGIYFLSIAHYSDAELLLQCSLDIRKKILSDKHSDTATSMDYLARLLYARGYYEEAEPLLKEALKIREEILGEEHPDTAMSLNNLAVLFNTIGQYKEAGPLHKQALKIRQKVLGEEHPDTALSLDNVANLFVRIGQYKKAEPLLIKALEIRQNILGEEHPSTATSINNLATLLRSIKRYKEAEPLYRKALEINKNVYGEEHPTTAGSFNNLAALLKTTGNYNEAEPLYRKSLEIYQKVFGEEHPDTAGSLNNLAGLLQATGRNTEVEQLYLRAMKIDEHIYGTTHPDVAIDYWNLATFWFTLNEKQPNFLRKNESKISELVKRAYWIFYHILGEKHKDTKKVKNFIKKRIPKKKRARFKVKKPPKPDENWSLLSEEWKK